MSANAVLMLALVNSSTDKREYLKILSINIDNNQSCVTILHMIICKLLHLLEGCNKNICCQCYGHCVMNFVTY